jgi:hypothetical protein
MLTGQRGLLAAFLAAMAFAGCVAGPQGSPSAGSPASSGGPISGHLAPGCEPSNLLGPDGQPIDLTGAWTGRQSVGFFQSPTETTFIRQVGDCVWAAIMDEEFRSDPNYVGDFAMPYGNLGTMRGQVTSDFVIEGELVSIRFGSPLAPAVFVQVRLLIDFDKDGRILLREDRTPGAGSRCYSFPGGEPFCPLPVILYRVDDLPAPAPSPI